MIQNRLESGFTSRSVGLETPSSGSWICILLSITISHVGESGSFDILVLANIIKRGMEHVKSNGARISYETTELSIFTFLRSRTRFGVELRKSDGIEKNSPSTDVLAKNTRQKRCCAQEIGSILSVFDVRAHHPNDIASPIFLRSQISFDRVRIRHRLIS